MLIHGSIGWLTLWLFCITCSETKGRKTMHWVKKNHTHYTSRSDTWYSNIIYSVRSLICTLIDVKHIHKHIYKYVSVIIIALKFTCSVSQFLFLFTDMKHSFFFCCSQVFKSVKKQTISVKKRNSKYMLAFCVYSACNMYVNKINTFL